MSPLNVHVRGLRQRPSDQPSRAICDPSTPSRLGRGRPPPAAPLTSPPRATRSFAVIWLSSERSGRLYAYHSAALACAWRACSRINQSSRHLMLVAKPRNRKWRLILRTCCPPPAAALRAAWGACGAPLAGGSSVYAVRLRGCARYTTGALWRAPGEHDYAVVASTRERVASIFTKTLGVPSAASIRSDVTVPGAPGGTA